MSNHTPGPWHVTDFLRIKSEGGKDVGYISSNHPVDQANARLIAAAPDLMAALEQMLDVFLDTEGTHGAPEQNAMSAGYAAIAKAKGEA